MIEQYKGLFLRVLIALAIGGILVYLVGDRVYITSDLISNTITFLSIAFGFYITSFSIFTTSKYVARLYTVEDENSNKKQTLMDALIYKYRAGLLVTLVSLIYVLATSFLIVDNKPEPYNLHRYYSLIIPTILLNFIYAFEMMSILIKVIKQTAKLNRE